MFTEVPWPWFAVSTSILLLVFILITVKQAELRMKLEEELRQTQRICTQCESIVSNDVDPIPLVRRGSHRVP